MIFSLSNIKIRFAQLSLVSKIIIIVFLLVVVWGGYTKVSSSTSKQPQYQTVKVERGTIVLSLSASGQIASAGNMPVTTQTSGVVKKVFVKNGTVVKAGQNLFEMNPDQQSLQRQTQAWASYLSAKNSLDSANAALYTLQSDMLTQWKGYMDIAQSSTYQNSDKSPKIDQRMLPEFISTNDDWLATEAKYKNQQGVIAQSKASLTSAWNSYQAVSPMVSAPIAGRVEDITLVLGMVISSQTNSSGNVTAQRLATIKTDANPIATFNLAEIDVVKVAAGQKVTITLDALPDKTFTGKVIGVDKTGVVSSGVTNYPTTVQFDTQPVDVLSNMSATANIIIDSKDDILLVPSSAVQTISGQSTVRVMRNGKVIQQPVELGLSSDTQTEIISGVNEGDEVVTSTVTSGQTTGTSGSPFSALGGRGFGGGFAGGGNRGGGTGR